MVVSALATYYQIVVNSYQHINISLQQNASESFHGDLFSNRISQTATLVSNGFPHKLVGMIT